MSRSFEVSLDSPGTVAQVHAAFGDRDYWLARLDALGGSRTLDSLTVESDGTISVVSTEDLRHGALPGILATLYRGDLNVVSSERWAPPGDREVRGEINVAVTGAPGSGHGAAVLAPSARGSQLKLSGTVEFRVPVIGGRIEDYLARVIVEGLSKVQSFTTEWIIDHA